LITSDTDYYNFLNNFLTDTAISNKDSNNLALFSIENDTLNFVDMHVLETDNRANFSINLKTAQDLIIDDINVIGIYYTQPTFVTINDDIINKNYGDIFTVSVKQLSYDDYNNKYTNHYMFPDS